MGILLLLQIGGAGAFTPASLTDQVYASAAVDVIGSDATGLSAAIGQPVPLCAHDDTGSPTPGAPTLCDHCTLCQVMADGVALPPGAATIDDREAMVASSDPWPATAAKTASRHPGGPSPRGPPPLA